MFVFVCFHEVCSHTSSRLHPRVSSVFSNFIIFPFRQQAWPPFLFFHAIHAHVSDLFEALPRKTETWLFTVHQLNMLLFDNAFALQCFAYICRYFGRGTLLMFFSKRQGKVTRVGRLTNPPLPIGFVSLQISKRGASGIGVEVSLDKASGRGG